MKIKEITLVGHHIKMIKAHQKMGIIPSYLICQTIGWAYKRDFAYKLYKTMRWIDNDTLITTPTNLATEYDTDDICKIPCPYYDYCIKNDKASVFKGFKKRMGPLYEILEGDPEKERLKSPGHWGDFLSYVEFDVIPGNKYHWGDLKEMKKGESRIEKARNISKDKTHPLIQYFAKVFPEYNNLDEFIVNEVLKKA